jgi:ABC-2 type transport system ATP-binding protein
MIQVKNLVMDYGTTRAVDDVSFDVKEKEIVGLLGPNGAGKTTLMRILTTFLYPTAGTATLQGIDITEDPEQVRTLIGYLPETPPLYMDMRVDDYLSFVAQARCIAPSELKKRMDWVIAATQIENVWKHLIGELSLGYRQRVGLAQALVHDPAVIILDEPTSGLDPMQIVSIRQLIKDLAQTKTIIFSTHILQEASAVADRLVIIDRGKIIANNTADELRKTKSQESVIYVTLQAPREEAGVALRSIPNVREVKIVGEAQGGTRFSCAGVSFDEVGTFISQLARQKGWTLKELAQRESSLEEIFLSFFEKEQHEQS